MVLLVVEEGETLALGLSPKKSFTDIARGLMRSTSSTPREVATLL